MENITARVEASLALERSEADLKRAQTVAKIGNFHLDIIANTLKWSDETYRIFGLPSGSALTYEIFMGAIHEDDREWVATECKAALEGRPYDIEHRIVVNGEVRWVREKGELDFNADGQVRGVFGVAQDITDRKKIEETAHQHEQFLSLATEAGKIGLWDWHLNEDRVVWNDTEYDVLGIDKTVRPGLEAVLTRVAAEDREKVQRNIKEALAAKSELLQEYRIGDANRKFRWISSRAHIERNNSGNATRMYGVNIDISKERSAQENAELLLAEVNHRTKNLLAVVQSIALITAKDNSSGNIAEFIERLNGLATSQDLLVEANWNDVDLHKLIIAQIAHYINLIGDRIKIDGPHVPLSANVVQTIGIAIHELATNAAKHGARSNETGRIEIKWRISGTANNQKLDISWIESDGPVPKQLIQKGFGYEALVGMVELGIDAKVEFELLPTGLVWRCSAHLSDLVGHHYDC